VKEKKRKKGHLFVATYGVREERKSSCSFAGEKEEKRVCPAKTKKRRGGDKGELGRSEGGKKKGDFRFEVELRGVPRSSKGKRRGKSPISSSCKGEKPAHKLFPEKG